MSISRFLVKEKCGMAGSGGFGLHIGVRKAKESAEKQQCDHIQKIRLNELEGLDGMQLDLN